MAEAQLKQKNRKCIWSALSFVFLAGMIGAGAYAAIGSAANVNNEISVGAVNISLDHYREQDGSTTRGVYDSEEVSSGATIISVPKIKNLGISSYIRLAVRYYDEAGSAAERAEVNSLGVDWVQKGEYYYLTREAAAGEEFDVFQGITAPASWDDNNRQIVMVLQADAIQAVHFNPDFTSDTPWGAIAIEDFADEGYQIDSESHASAVTVSYDGVAEQYVSVPENFLAQLNVLAPGDAADGEITVNNSDDEEHEVWVSVEVPDADLASALTVRIMKDGVVLYEGPLAGLSETSLGKFAPGAMGAIEITLGLPIDTGNGVGSIHSSINWKFRVDAEEEPIPVGPNTEDSIEVAVLLFLVSFVGLIIVSLFEKREQDEEAWY